MRIHFANRAVQERLGIPLERLERVAFSEMLRPEDRERFRHDWLASDPQELFQCHYPIRTANGGLIQAHWSISSRPAAPNQDPDHTVTLVWEHPEATEAEPTPETELSGDHAFELNKADTIAHITQGIVHDFNNSLTAIRGHLEVAMPEALGTSLQGALEQAMEATMTTGKLCQRLLNYAKGRRSTKRPCRVEDLIQQAVAITGLGSNVTCRRLIDDHVWPVLADSIEIVQVINNLLVNAQQAMPQGGIIALVAENAPMDSDASQGLPPGNYVALRVRDRGVGIPPEKQKRIFEALYTTKTNGTGLGLATCAQIVSTHQGLIDVHSVPNHGSEFSVYLPAADPKLLETESPTPAPVVAPQAIESSPLKILIVEDQEGISRMAKLYLEKNGHSVTCVEDGQQAVDTFRRGWQMGDGFELGILDITLPGGMDGVATFRELRAIDPEFVGIATSGYMDGDSLSHYQQKGFATVLPKPYALQRLTEAVHEAMLFHMVP